MLTSAVTYMGEIKARSFSFDGFHSFSPCGVQGKLKFLLSFGFTVSLEFYFVFTHWILPVLVSIWRKFEICKLILKYFK